MSFRLCLLVPYSKTFNTWGEFLQAPYHCPNDISYRIWINGDDKILMMSRMGVMKPYWLLIEKKPSISG